MDLCKKHPLLIIRSSEQRLLRYRQVQRQKRLIFCLAAFLVACIAAVCFRQSGAKAESEIAVADVKMEDEEMKEETEYEIKSNEESFQNQIQTPIKEVRPQVNSLPLALKMQEEWAEPHEIMLCSTEFEPIVEEAENKFILTAEERNLLERLVEAEAEGEPFIGKVAVANVVLNRLNDEDFPDTITDVIMEKGQFSPVDDGRINIEPTEDSKKAVEKAVDEAYKVFNDSVVYFCNTKTAQNTWMIKQKEIAMVIGKHTFFFK